MKKISVIIPVYNSEKHLNKCLNSIINQTFKNIEIILVDDGSQDNSLQIIKDYSERYTNIVYLSKENEGQAIARNIGINMAGGEFICFVDSDDYIDKEMLEKLYNSAIKNNSDIVICDYIEEYPKKNIYKKSLFIDADSIKRSYITSVAGPCSKIIKTSLFKENKLKFLENNIYEDLAMIPALALYTDNISYCEEYLYHYVIRENSTMQQLKYNSTIESIFNVMECLYNKFGGYDYKDELEFLYINHLLYAGCGRFLQYKNTSNHIEKINEIMKNKFPNWKQNKYYLKQNKKFQLTCNIFARNNFLEINVYKLLRKII